jgi:hypothetical protein
LVTKENPLQGEKHKQSSLEQGSKINHPRQDGRREFLPRKSIARRKAQTIKPGNKEAKSITQGKMIEENSFQVQWLHFVCPRNGLAKHQFCS